MRPWRRREEPDLGAVLKRLGDRLHPSTAANVEELARVAGPDVAIEWLAGDLCKASVALDAREERDIERLAHAAGADPARWTPLRELVAPRPSPERIVLSEFGTYYLSDEIEYPYSEALLERAEGTAVNWVAWYSPNEARVAAALLRELAADPAHPLHDDLTRASNLAWEEAEAWPWFQRLALAIADRVEELAY